VIEADEFPGALGAGTNLIFDDCERMFHDLELS
jgi:hypothetical protein